MTQKYTNSNPIQIEFDAVLKINDVGGQREIQE